MKFRFRDEWRVYIGDFFLLWLNLYSHCLHLQIDSNRTTSISFKLFFRTCWWLSLFESTLDLSDLSRHLLDFIWKFSDMWLFFQLFFLNRWKNILSSHKFFFYASFLIQDIRHSGPNEYRWRSFILFVKFELLHYSLLEYFIMLFYVCSKDETSLFLTAEDIIEVVDENIAVSYWFCSVDNVCHRSCFWSHKARTKTDCYIIGIHLIFLLSTYDLFLQKFNQKGQSVEVKLWKQFN